MKDRKKYRRIIFEDRQKIEKMCAEGKDTYEIAVAIGVHPITMARELERGGIPYKAEVAQKSL